MSVVDDFGQSLCVEKIDYFWTNSDLMEYLLQFGNAPVEASAVLVGRGYVWNTASQYFRFTFALVCS
jgi:hypothetical protein